MSRYQSLSVASGLFKVLAALNWIGTILWLFLTPDIPGAFRVTLILGGFLGSFIFWVAARLIDVICNIDTNVVNLGSRVNGLISMRNDSVTSSWTGSPMPNQSVGAASLAVSATAPTSAPKTDPTVISKLQLVADSELTVVPDRGPAGSTALATIMAAANASSVSLWWSDASGTNTRIGMSGRIDGGQTTISFTVPAYAEPGTYNIVASDSVTVRKAPFHVEVKAAAATHSRT